MFLLFLLMYLLVVQAEVQRFAVIRPFAVPDTFQLGQSFDIWNINTPCTVSFATEVDLFLCFSQTLANNNAAAAATNSIIQAFNASKASGRTDTWHHCFRRVWAISAQLTVEEDTYRPGQSGAGTSWVKGPNKQFIFMAQAFQDNLWGAYDAWYLMEMDSVPHHSNWLVDLLAEVNSRAPFAILGSFYRGDLWDKLTMPLPIHLHINGNAVYNNSNPLMQTMLKQLSTEMASDNLTSAFDVRMAELYLSSQLTADQFGWYAGDSTIIGNYAHTSVVDSYFNGEAIIHGAYVFDAWNIAANPVALVLSDFGQFDANGQRLLKNCESSLARGRHPFREVVEVLPPEIAPLPPYTRSTNGAAGPETMNIIQVKRADSAWYDWCTVPVTSAWFMYSNVYLDLGRRIDLLKAVGLVKPVATYLKSNTTFCPPGSACRYSVERASNFTGIPFDRYYDTSQMVFRTSLRDEFCAAWRNWYNTKTTVGGCDPIPGPVATDYMAYLQKRGLTDAYYDVRDVLQYGQRDRGVLMTVSKDDRPCAFKEAVVNASLCDSAADFSSCHSIPGCSWRVSFGTCFNGSLAAVVQPPTFSVSFSYNDNACQGSTALPQVLLDPIEQSKLGIVASPVTVAPTATSSGENRLLPGTVVLKTTATMPQLVKTVPVDVYDLSDISFNISVTKTFIGRRITVSSSAPKSSLLEVLVTPPPIFGSPVTTVAGYVRSTDSAALGTVILDTTGLPINSTSLAISARQTVPTAGRSFFRCSTTYVTLVPPPSIQCSANVSLNVVSARGGDTITASVSSFSIWANQTPKLSYIWGIGGCMPVPSSTPNAQLVVPHQTTAGTVNVTVVATDEYGRTQTCTAPLLVAATPAAVALQQASQQCQSSNATSDPHAADTCLQLMAVVATSSNAVAARQVLLSTLDQMADDLNLTTPSQCNVVLDRLATLTSSKGNTVIDDDVQDRVIDVMGRLADKKTLDSSSAGRLLPVVVPMLLNIISATSTVPSYSPRGGEVTNATLAQQNGLKITSLLEKAFTGIACSESTLYSGSSLVSEGNCINASWGLYTSNSISGVYQQAQLSPNLASILPPLVRVVVLSLSHDCNALRDTLGSTAQLRRVLFLNATSCQPLPAEYFINASVHNISLWFAPLVFEGPPLNETVPSANETTPSLNETAPTQRRTRAESQFLQAMCVTTDPITGASLKFPPVEGYCPMGLPGTVTGTWFYGSQPRGMGYFEPLLSPSPDIPVETLPSPIPVVPYWWIIVVPIVVIVPIMVAAAWLYFWKYRKAGCHPFAPEPPSTPSGTLSPVAWEDPSRQWSPQLADFHALPPGSMPAFAGDMEDFSPIMQGPASPDPKEASDDDAHAGAPSYVSFHGSFQDPEVLVRGKSPCPMPPQFTDRPPLPLPPHPKDPYSHLKAGPSGHRGPPSREARDMGYFLKYAVSDGYAGPAPPNWVEPQLLNAQGGTPQSHSPGQVLPEEMCDGRWVEESWNRMQMQPMFPQRSVPAWFVQQPQVGTATLLPHQTGMESMSRHSTAVDLAEIRHSPPRYVADLTEAYNGISYQSATHTRSLLPSMQDSPSTFHIPSPQPLTPVYQPPVYVADLSQPHIEPSPPAARLGNPNTNRYVISGHMLRASSPTYIPDITEPYNSVSHRSHSPRS